MSCMLSDMKHMQVLEQMVTIKSSMKAADIQQLECLADELLANE